MSPKQIFYTGVVEDVMDPLKVGRIRVRVVGVHTENKTLLPTDMLPWATPIMPISAASMNGIGSSPTGLVCGSWVALYFADGEAFQQPMVIGSIPGIPTSELNTYAGEEAPIILSTTSNTDSIFPQDLLPNELSSVDLVGSLLSLLGLDTSALNAKDGIQFSAESFKQVQTYAPPSQQPSSSAIQSPLKNPTSWTLGQTSAEFESGTRGVSAINDYNGSANWDKGGASYGLYQLASYLPTQIPYSAIKNAGILRERRRPSPVQEYLKSSRFGSQFAGLEPATPQFDAKWKQLASEYEKDFALDQHDYIKLKYYDPVISKLKAKGINLENNGPAVHDAIWSTAVQFWHTSATKLVVDALEGKTNVSDTEFVNLVYDLKLKRYPSEAKRIAKEKAKLLQLISSGATRDGLNTSDSTADGTNGSAEVRDLPQVNQQSPRDFDFQASNSSEYLMSNAIGFTDPSGKYPVKSFLNEPDVNRLSRNDKINQTIVYKKKNNRLTGVTVANGGGAWSQPEIPYAAQYPFNKVVQTESGHTLELDDTPGAERVHVYHKAGSFVEIDNNGSMVRKIVGDDYVIVERNGNIFIGGKCNLTVSGSINIYSYGNTNVESDGDVNVIGHNDVTVTANGGVDIAARETFTVKANKIVLDSDTTVEVSASDKIRLTSDNEIATVSDTISTKAHSELKFASQGNTDIYSVGNVSTRTLSNIYSDAAGIVAVQSNFASAKNFDADPANKSSFGLPADGRRDMDDVDLEPLVPTTRIDGSSFYFETDEEATNSVEYQKYKNGMIVSGNARAEDFESVPIRKGSDDTPYGGARNIIPPDEVGIKSMENFPDGLKLSPNFTLGQVSSLAAVTKNRVRDQYGLTAQDVVANLQCLCLNVLEPIFREYPNMFVTSGFRHANSGSKISDHVLGQAVDMQFKGAKKSDYFEIAKKIKQLVPYKQLLLEYKNVGTGMPWIHISVSRDSAKNTGQTMTFFNHAKYSDGLTDLA